MASYSYHRFLFLTLPGPLFRRDRQFRTGVAVVSRHLKQPVRLKKNETDTWTNNKSQLFCFHDLPVKTGRTEGIVTECSSFVRRSTRYTAWSGSHYLTFILNFCLSLHHRAELYIYINICKALDQGEKEFCSRCAWAGIKK